ncbi:hypothetical protein D3C85_1437940 [compost metagenome]
MLITELLRDFLHLKVLDQHRFRPLHFRLRHELLKGRPCHFFEQVRVVTPAQIHLLRTVLQRQIKIQIGFDIIS